MHAGVSDCNFTFQKHFHVTKFIKIKSSPIFLYTHTNILFSIFIFQNTIVYIKANCSCTLTPKIENYKMGK